jgi:stage V sporulation protein AC
MRKNKYTKLVDKHKPKEEKGLNLLKSFIIGGLLGIVGHFILEYLSGTLEMSQKDASTITIIILIFAASLFTAIGFFDSWVKYARAGLIVPITGFAHAMTSASLEYKREGLITGIGSNIFKLSGSVILYGIVSAYVFGLIRFLVFGQ